jgi:hypothetical protein
MRINIPCAEGLWIKILIDDFDETFIELKEALDFL